MFVQQDIHISLSISLYHSTRSFQYINTCEKHDRAFILLLQKMLHNLFPTSIKIHRKLIISKYKK
jgi:hypothetical protein